MSHTREKACRNCSFAYYYSIRTIFKQKRFQICPGSFCHGHKLLLLFSSTLEMQDMRLYVKERGRG